MTHAENSYRKLAHFLIPCVAAVNPSRGLLNVSDKSTR